MNKYNKILSNSAVFIIGNFGSKLINFFMVPLYTNVLLTSEYGVVDLMNVTISLLIPFFTFELGKSALRFVLDEKNNRFENKVFSNIVLFYAFISILLLIISPIVLNLELFQNYGVLFLMLFYFRIFNEIYSQYLRGLKLIKEYAINGILMTIVTVLSNILFLVVLKLGIQGYIISMIGATLVSNIYMFIVSSGFQKLKNINFDRNLLSKMFKFSLPLIPSAALWWIINGSTKYFVLFFVGASANGIYAVASKIPSIISMLTSVFSQAWQLSSYEEYESEDRERFYSNIYNMYFTLMFIVSSSILVVLKPLISIFVSEAYFSSWTIVPFLLLGVIYQSLSGFYGIIYQAFKKTKGSLITSIYGGVASVISSFLLVPIYGAIGAGISTSISFFVTYVTRVIDTRKIMNIKIDYKISIVTNLIFILQIIVLFAIDNYYLYVFQSSLFIIMLLINRKILLKTVFFLMKSIRIKRN